MENSNRKLKTMEPPARETVGSDEVDFIVAPHNNNNEYEDLRSVSQAVINTKATLTIAPKITPTTITPNNEPNVANSNTNTNKFVKSNSLARLLGNTYNAKKFEKQEQKRLEGCKFNTYSGRRGRAGPYLERFKRVSKEDGDIAGGGDNETVRVTNVVTLTTDSRDLQYGSRQEHVGRQSSSNQEQQDQMSSSKAMRTLTRSLGKLWKRTHSVDISTPDPEFKVSYLGNVLTGWAKGEGCVEKQLNTLWRNYTQHTKPDVIMRLKVCASGLKATTRQHGLTEYWAHRITYCCAPKNYPRVFCWIYRHEGRKLKHELRCHAVLCSKEKIAQDICDTLRENLESALREFKREKILKQNARLSLANAVYDNQSLPRRKIMLSVGGNNYRPPLERSKSAPKLMAIEEAIGEEEGDEIEDTNEPEMRACCQRDSLYPAMTLGRRRCRHGHSMRKQRASDQASLQYRHQAQSSISSNASSSTTASTSAAAGTGSGAQQGLVGPDSHEGSISSGCETASTVTNANHEEYIKRGQDQGPELEQAQVLEQMMIYQRLEQQLRNNSDATNYSSSSSITLKRSDDSTSDDLDMADKPAGRNNQNMPVDSDESGYVEFQVKERIVQASNEPPHMAMSLVKVAVKPQIPPKPAPRRSLSLNAKAATAATGAGKASGTAV
ncbi:uncharacterized protein LOC117187357 [Drosophila miranda]|uniref:uncharacterized protein LOC117187357 n=1 Tax=Drosophila miranda TaxID=7229 RepID=UPI00143F2993|nr:uncharacterized protein LOC117187357 [Drosophila miranda]